MPQAVLAPVRAPAPAPAARPQPRPAGPATEREEAARPAHAFAGIRIHAAPGAIQPKLTVSRPGDPLEEEADRVAEAVMRAVPASSVTGRAADAVQREPSGASEGEGRSAVGPVLGHVEGGTAAPEEDEPEIPEPVEPAASEVVHRSAEADGEEEEDDDEEDDGGAAERVMARADATGRVADEGPVPRELAAARAAGGRPLPEGPRAAMEAAFGADFAAVRIHDDARADSLARSLGAAAFANRSHLFFRAGRFDPASSEGRRLLAHELTHVVQQVPSVRGAAAAPGADERVALAPEKGAAPEYRMIGRIYLLDAGGNVVLEVDFYLNGDPGLTGAHTATFEGKAGKRAILFAGKRFPLDKEPPELDAAVRAANSASVLLFSGTGGGKAPEKAGAPGGSASKSGGTSPGKPGSKYGWLGLLDLDQETIDVLEKVFEALEDEEEYLALKETVQMLAELEPLAGEIRAWFADEDRLLAVALGLEDSAAVAKLEAWVARAPTKRKLETKRADRKGIVAIARKVARLIEKVRQMLRPVFAVRAGFVGLVAGVTEILEGMPVVQTLLDPAARAGTGPKELLSYFSEEFAKSLQGKMEELRKGFQIPKTAIEPDELVSSEELGRAVLSLGLKLVPGAGKLAVKLAQKLPRLEGLVADKVVAPLIPKAALDGLNQQITGIAALLEPARTKANAGLDEIFSGMEAALEEYLSKELADLALLLSPAAGGARRGAGAELRLRHLMSASGGEPLPGALREEMEGHLGMRLDGVRIHRDRAAGQASDLIRANAFAHGRDLYFGPGRYAPESAEGRRLLAHELAHVAQQGGDPDGPIRRDYKGLRDKLVRKIGEKVKAGMKVGMGGSPAKQARAKVVREVELEKLRGRKVVSLTNPALPEPYHYVTDSKGRIRSIRRSLSWIRYVPSLKIDQNGRIKLGVELSFDPKDADRRALRKSCGCAKGQQAHHVIPLELRGDPIVKLAEANGFQFNGTANGVCLSDKVHAGSHPNYTKRVAGVLAALAVAYPGGKWSPALAAAFHGDVKKLKTYCGSRTSKLT